MSRTPTLPPTDRGMWRRALARLHPDSGGNHELFLWGTVVRDLVCDGSEPRRASPRTAPPPDDKPRVPFPDFADFAELTELTARALDRAAAGDGYGRLLALLEDCRPLEHLDHEQRRGASYKRLAAIGHMWGMTKTERVEWYRVAEEIPLADRHAGHILSKLKRAAA